MCTSGKIRFMTLRFIIMLVLHVAIIDVNPLYLGGIHILSGWEDNSVMIDFTSLPYRDLLFCGSKFLSFRVTPFKNKQISKIRSY